MREKCEIEKIVKGLPGDDEVFKVISYGGFSSIGFVQFIANKTKINRMSVSTLRVGKKHLKCLDMLYRQGKLGHVRFLIGNVMKNDSKTGLRYGYYDNLQSICDKNGWDVVVKTNHSKILLFDTDLGKFVIETSSNLNENPNMEQFSFEKSDKLYDFYNQVFDEQFL